jgi:hypothetical protein
MNSRPQLSGKDGPRRLYVVLRSSARGGAIAAATRCLNRLVPEASVLVAPASPPADADAEVVTLDAEEVAAGPLSAASALERERATADRVRRRGS